MQYGEPRADRCPRIANWLFQVDYKYVYKHRYRRTQKRQHFVQQSHEVRVQVVKHGETRCGYELSSACSFSLLCVRSRLLLQSFHIILGPGGFPHERIAMKQQSRSLAERS